MMMEKEAQIVIDYSTLSEHLKELDDPDDVRKMETGMQKDITDLMNIIHKIQVTSILANTFNEKQIQLIDRFIEMYVYQYKINFEYH